MVARKITITLPDELRRRGARKAIADWQVKHGAFTPEELAATRAEMAAADVELLGIRTAAA